MPGRERAAVAACSLSRRERGYKLSLDPNPLTPTLSLRGEGVAPRHVEQPCAQGELMGTTDQRILISGGGPVGLLCAWLLGRRGLPVAVFDDNSELQNDPRAATTHPATLDLLEEDGLADDMARVGLVAPIFQFWDRPSGQLVAEFDHAV